MKYLGVSLVLVLLKAAAWAHVLPKVIRPGCNSSEAEAAALVAQDYINSQHIHGYKYALNRIEDIKIMPGREDIYSLELELLETNCHVLDPTPLANCTVRPKAFTAVEGDCDVILKKSAGGLMVTAFKCKTEESTEDLCLGCPTLLPLNDTKALDFVYASLATFNNLTANDPLFSLMEVGRMAKEVVSGGAVYSAEYVIEEANCTGDMCVNQTDSVAQRGFCRAKGVNSAHSVDCNMFPSVPPFTDTNTTVNVPVVTPVVNIHSSNITSKHGLRYHALTPLHDPQLSGLLSESDESTEVVPVAHAAPTDSVGKGLNVMVEAPAVVVKREASGPDPNASIQLASKSLIPLCPGTVKYY